MTENLVCDIVALIRPNMVAQARNGMYEAVNEAVKTVMRMCQDAKVVQEQADGQRRTPTISVPNASIYGKRRKGTGD